MIEVARLHRVENGSSLKAFADVVINQVLVKGVRIIEGTNGLFVTMPKSQGKDSKWYPTVTLVDKSMQSELQSIVLEVYQV
ncbi:MAG: septation protein SpoVG family protein [Candidatus Omnitrophota bacterium]|nr:septation protein SpoVG family protein [Candidatus Omnitrophota bacterium]